MLAQAQGRQCYDILASTVLEKEKKKERRGCRSVVKKRGVVGTMASTYDSARAPALRVCQSGQPKGTLVVEATYDARTLVVKGKDGYGHGECVLAKARHLGCDFVGLQETRRRGRTYSTANRREHSAGKGYTALDWL